jgi:hypothetical protein
MVSSNVIAQDSLLVQAQARVQHAKKAEDNARRTWPQTVDTAVTIRRAQEEHLAARSHLERLQRSIVHLHAALPDARTDRRRAEGVLAEVQRLERELENIAGASAVLTEA